MKRSIVVASITLGMLLAALDQMIMSTAMPEVQKILGSPELYSWVFSGYMLASTITVPIFGKLADRYGRKNTYLAALTLFLIGSVLCALSANMWQLVIFRVIQGLGAGGVIPLTVTIAGDLFSVEERGKIQGLFSTMWAVAGVSGPVVGGWIIENLHWSWIFWLNIPVGILAIIGFLTAFRDEEEGERNRIDYGGALLLSVAVGTFLYATLVDSVPKLAVLIVASLVLFVWFIRNQKSKTAPLIRIQMFGNPMILWLNVTGMLLTMGMLVVPVFVPLYAQDVLGHTPLASGLILMGQVVGWNIGSVPAGKLIIRYGYQKVIMTGISLVVLAGALLVFLTKWFGYWFLVGDMFILGVGFGVAFTALTIGVQEAVDWKERGISTSIQIFSRNIGSTVGIALVGGVLNMTRDTYSLAESFQIVFAVSATIALLSWVSSMRIPVRQMEKSGG